MAWPKIKNIIILILLGANLGLLVFTVGSEVRGHQLLAQARSQSILFLQEHGIRVEESQIPRAMTLAPMQVSRDIQQESALAEVLLDGNVSVDARGAEVYRYYNSKGSVQFHSNGEFSAQFSTGTFPLADQTLETHGLHILNRLGIEGKVIQRLESDRQTSVVFQEYWEGIPLLNCQATLNYQEGYLVSITGGRRLTGKPVQSGGAEPITVATALMRFYTGMSEPGDVFTRISGITEGYVVTSTISDPMPLTPVWYISTDVGTFQMDILTGNSSRVM